MQNIKSSDLSKFSDFRVAYTSHNRKKSDGMNFAKAKYLGINRIDQMAEAYMTYDYNDINLIPQLSTISSRSECNTSMKLGTYNFRLPVVPANMISVINEDICELLAQNNYFYTMHRFDIDTLAFVRKMHNKGLYASISIGVSQERYDIIDQLAQGKLSPAFITIDIAHGHSILMRDMLKHVGEKLPEAFIIGGNIATLEAAYDLIARGAHGIKCGIAPGLGCSTYMETGFGSRRMQASVVHSIAQGVRKKYSNTIAIIADGGIRKNGDIAVALAMGADMVMVGSAFANLSDSPNPTHEINGVKVKQYFGSASAHQPNKKERIEGVSHNQEVQDINYLQKMTLIEHSLQSAISYAGGNDLSALQKVPFVVLGKHS